MPMSSTRSWLHPAPEFLQLVDVEELSMSSRKQEFHEYKQYLVAALVVRRPGTSDWRFLVLLLGVHLRFAADQRLEFNFKKNAHVELFGIGE
eukprot:839302-Pyramimonas_sp.AAC.1